VLSYFQRRQRLETLIGVGPFLVRAIENVFDSGPQTVRMTEEDLKALRAAAATLEHPGLAARLGNIAGKPIELMGRALPEAASEACQCRPRHAGAAGVSRAFGGADNVFQVSISPTTRRIGWIQGQLGNRAVAP
jgi:hypothetical protein